MIETNFFEERDGGGKKEREREREGGWQREKEMWEWRKKECICSNI